jgi:hypothetical protein
MAEYCKEAVKAFWVVREYEKGRIMHAVETRQE